jgi:signal transduction histidine kinase
MKLLPSLKISLLLLVASLGGIVTLFSATTHFVGESHWLIAIIAGLLLLFSAFIAIVFHYQSALAKAKENLDEAHLSVEGLITQKDHFIRRLGHDLYTPLTPLVALLPMILSRSNDEKQRQWIKACIANVQHIHELVASSMQLAKRFKPTRLQLNLACFYLAPAVDDFLSLMDAEIENHDLKVVNRIPQDLTIHSDRSEIQEVFSLLVQNVVQFAPRGSRLIIDAEATGDEVCVSLHDEGIGLSDEERLQIFDEFYKADPSRHELRSSGLGLSICRQIIVNHGGRIWAESPGKGLGTTIKFTLSSGGNHDSKQQLSLKSDDCGRRTLYPRNSPGNSHLSRDRPPVCCKRR